VAANPPTSIEKSKKKSKKSKTGLSKESERDHSMTSLYLEDFIMLILL
jgi:hypothetical protein